MAEKDDACLDHWCTLPLQQSDSWRVWTAKSNSWLAHWHHLHGVAGLAAKGKVGRVLVTGHMSCYMLPLPEKSAIFDGLEMVAWVGNLDCLVHCNDGDGADWGAATLLC